MNYIENGKMILLFIWICRYFININMTPQR